MKICNQQAVEWHCTTLNHIELEDAICEHMKPAMLPDPWAGTTRTGAEKQIHMQTCTWGKQNLDADRWGEKATYPILGVPLSDACKIKDT